MFRPNAQIVPLPASEQENIYAEAEKASFSVYVPEKIVSGYSIAPRGGVSGGASFGTRHGVDTFQVLFLGPGAGTLHINEYPYQRYLTRYGYTPEEFIGDSKKVPYEGGTAYISDGYTREVPEFQYVQGVTTIRGDTLVKVSYFGTNKLSDEELVEFIAGF